MEWISLMLLVSLHVRNNRSSSVPTFGDTSRISDANLMSVIEVTVAVAHPNRLLLYQLKARTLTTPPLKEVTTPNEAEEVESTKMVVDLDAEVLVIDLRAWGLSFFSCCMDGSYGSRTFGSNLLVRHALSARLVLDLVALLQKYDKKTTRQDRKTRILLPQDIV